MKKFASLVAAWVVFTSAALLPAAHANEEEFYNGKTITLIIPFGPGGVYDAFARLISRHLANQIPGNPTIVPRNMPGGGGLIASNYIYNVAPHDGTTLIIITSTFAIEQLLDTSQIKYDARNFQAIGRLTDTTSAVVFSHSSAIKKAADLFILPSVAAVESLTEIFATRYLVMNRLLGTKIKLVPGYRSSRDFALASQRGEVDGFWIPFITLKQFYAADLKEKKFNIVLQSATSRDKEMPDVPTLLELSDNPEAKQIFRYLVSNDEIGRSLFTTPGVPPARMQILQSAFQKMLADPDFKEDAEKRSLPLSPKSGKEIQDVVLGTFDASPEILNKVRELTRQ